MDPPVSEVSYMRAFINSHMIPAMHPHQRILTVPGIFGSHAVTSTGQVCAIALRSQYLSALGGRQCWR